MLAGWGSRRVDWQNLAAHERLKVVEISFANVR